MGTRIKIKRGTESSIVANKDSLEWYEIVYAKDTGKLGIRGDELQNSIDTEDGIVWFIPKDTYNIEMGKGAYSNGYSGIAIGANAYAGETGIAIGVDASTVSDEIAIGRQAKVKTSANGGIALGKAAEINVGASKSIAIGQNAKANTSNTIQLGENAVDFTLNVGNKKAPLIGDYTSYSAISTDISLTFNQIFGDNAPIGTIAEMIITTSDRVVSITSGGMDWDLEVSPQFIDIKKDSSLFFEVNNGASTPTGPRLTPIKLILFKNDSDSAIILECDKLRNLNETYTETTLTSTNTIKLVSYGYRNTAPGEQPPQHGSSYYKTNTKTTVYIKRR